MTIRDPDEIVAAWLDEGPSRLPEQTRRAISVALPTTSQRRRGWSVPWRSSTMSTNLKYAIGAVAVVAIAFGGWFFLAPAPSGVGAGPGPTPSPSPAASPSASPSPSVAPSPTSYSSSKFEVPIQLAVMDGWTLDADYAAGVDLSGPAQPASIMSIASMTVRGKTPGTWVPWPADIHAWLSSRPEFRPTAPRPITVGGRPGSVIDVDVVVPLADTGDWVRNGPQGINLRSVGASGWRMHLVVVPTGSGTGIVAYTDAPPAGFDEGAASLDRLLATLEFR